MRRAQKGQTATSFCNNHWGMISRMGNHFQLLNIPCK
jgi:hypothetical protein